MDHSTSGLPVHHQLPESAQTHIHWVGDAIQPSHPLLSPSPPAFNLSLHQGLFFLFFKCSFVYLIYLSALGLSCGMWDLVPWPGIELGRPALGAWSLSHWTTREAPSSGTFQMTQLFTSGGQSIGVSASTSVLSMNTQDRSPLWWTGWISLQSKRLSRVFSQYHSSKASILQCSAFFIVQFSHPYTTTGKIIALTRLTFVGKVISLLFNMLSRLVITFLPKSKRLLISWLQSPSQWFWSPPE